MSAGSKRGGFFGALFKWLAIAALTLVILSCLAVLTLRWVHPFTSAYMLEAVPAFVVPPSNRTAATDTDSNAKAR